MITSIITKVTRHDSINNHQRHTPLLYQLSQKLPKNRIKTMKTSATSSCNGNRHPQINRSPSTFIVYMIRRSDTYIRSIFYSSICYLAVTWCVSNIIYQISPNFKANDII